MKNITANSDLRSNMMRRDLSSPDKGDYKQTKENRICTEGMDERELQENKGEQSISDLTAEVICISIKPYS